MTPIQNSTLDSLIILTLASSFLIIGGRRLKTAIVVAVIQAVLLASVTAYLGWVTGNHEIYIAALLTIVVKMIVIPLILNRVVNRIGVNREINSYVNMNMSFIISAALVMMAYYATGKIEVFDKTIVTSALPAALAMILIGLFVMITRKLAIMQIIGLLIMENGLYLAGVGTTNGMPLVVELGIFLDILVGVLIMGILAFRINQNFDSINTEDLKNLRG